MHPLDWKLLHSEYVLHDRWLALRADTCQLPNGRTMVPYSVLEYPPWVNVVALTADQQVVLVRQYRHGVRQTLLELPSGAVDAADASPLAAAPRELLEETGYGAGAVVETGRLSPNPAPHTHLTYCCLATEVRWVAEPHPEETEPLETVLLPLAEVVRLGSTGGLLQALPVGALLFALQALGKLSWRGRPGLCDAPGHSRGAPRRTPSARVRPLTWACRRRLPASARPSLPLAAAPDAWR